MLSTGLASIPLGNLSRNCICVTIHIEHYLYIFYINNWHDLEEKGHAYISENEMLHCTTEKMALLEINT